MKPVLENIRLEDQSIVAFRHCNKNFETPWHFHPQHELTYIEESVGTKFIGDYVGPYEPGELVLLRSNLPHCWKNYQTKKGHSTSTVIQWNKGIFTQVPELQPVFDMLRVAARGLLFDESLNQSLIPKLKSLPELPSDQLYVSLLALLIELAKGNFTTLSESSFVDDLPNEYNNRMSKIHDFVDRHYGRKIYLRELSDLVNMSEQSFSRFFSKMMGRPFFTFLNEYRINMASRMLINTDWSVAEIGFRCGYESLPFFHKQFNKFKSQSPSKFRKQYAEQLMS